MSLKDDLLRQKQEEDNKKAHAAEIKAEALTASQIYKKNSSRPGGIFFSPLRCRNGFSEPRAGDIFVLSLRAGESFSLLSPDPGAWVCRRFYQGKNSEPSSLSIASV